MTTNGNGIDSMKKIYDHVWHWIARQTYEVTDSPITNNPIHRKSKVNGGLVSDDCSKQTKSCQNMKSIVSPRPVNTKRITTTDYSDMERNNLYDETPPKTSKTSISPPTLVNGTSHYMPVLPTRRSTNPIRTDSGRSIGTTTSSMSSFSTATCSSQSTTPSNSFRNESSSIMTRSADASSSSSSCNGLVNPNTIKSKSTYDIETTNGDKIRQISNGNNINNSKIVNAITNGNFVPLQSVKEDECLEVTDDHSQQRTRAKNDDEQQRILIDILKHRYPKQHASSSSSSAVSTPIMPRSNSPHQRSSSTDPTDDESTLKNVGFTRGQRIRSSLPFIVKPALNSSKSNSLGLCFLICGNETKKVLLPAYISCVDTLKALFVRAFPQHLTMKHMDADDVRIYIREADKDLFYQLEDMSDVKDRAVLKVVQLNNNKSQVVQVPLKQQNEEVSMYVPFVSRPGLASEITYQRLSRLGRVPSTTSVPSRNGSIEEKPTSTAPMPLSNTTSSSSSSSSCSSSSSSSRSLSEPRRRPGNNENPAVHTSTPPTVNTTVPKGIISSPRSGSTTPTTPRLADDDARCKMAWMEKQLESLTELVKELTRERFVNEQNRTRFDGKSQSIRQKLYELKVKTHSLRNDLTNIRRMQQSMQDNFKLQIHSASKRIEEQIFRVHPTEIRSAQCRSVESELDLYTINSGKIDRDLEDLEASVEELQNDVKSKQCHVTMNDVESFALVLSTISRSLVDLKASFPVLREKICSLGQQSSLNDDQKFLHEEPERLDYTIKKCKRLTTMLYQLKRLAVSQEQKTLPMKHQRKFAFGSHGKIVDRKRLLEEIESATQNSDGRVKAIEKAERSRERRLYYTNQLEALKQMKYTSEQIDGRDSAQLFDTRSLTNSILLSSSTRTSICSTQSTSDSTPTSNNCPSPSLSFIVRQALISPTAPPNEIKTPAHLNGNGSRLQSAMKPPSKVTFCQQLITNGNKSTTVNSRDHSIDSSLSGNILINGNNKKNKPTPPPRLQSVSASSSAVSSAASCSSSSSSSSSSNGGNSRENRLVNGFCGIIPLVISPDRRHNGRCNSFSSSSTDTDSVISNPRMPITLKSPPPPPPPPVPSSSSSQNTNPTVMNSKPMVMPNGFHHKTTLMRASVTDL